MPRRATGRPGQPTPLEVNQQRLRDRQRMGRRAEPEPRTMEPGQEWRFGWGEATQQPIFRHTTFDELHRLQQDIWARDRERMAEVIRTHRRAITAPVRLEPPQRGLIDFLNNMEREHPPRFTWHTAELQEYPQTATEATIMYEPRRLHRDPTLEWPYAHICPKPQSELGMQQFFKDHPELVGR